MGPALRFILVVLVPPGPPVEGGLRIARLTSSSAIEESRAGRGEDAVRVSLPDWFPISVPRAGVTWVTARLAPPLNL